MIGNILEQKLFWIKLMLLRKNMIIMKHLRHNLQWNFLSEVFGFNYKIPIEGSACEYHNKFHNDVGNEGKMKMDFHPNISYDYSQNSTTTSEHMEKFIHWVYYNTLFITDGIIYDNIYGYRKKQYIFTNSMGILSVLEITYRMIIDRCINDPGHGRGKVYVINGYDKTYLEKHVFGRH